MAMPMFHWNLFEKEMDGLDVVCRFMSLHKITIEI
jgi:hypothetical protein